MKMLRLLFGTLLLVGLAAGIWVVTVHTDWLKTSSHEPEEKDAETEVPVKTGKVTRATLRSYVEAFGLIEPAPAFAGQTAAGATLTAFIPGIVAQVNCAVGQKVERGAVLFQLDDRIATATANQAAAALESARASFVRLKATPRPEQLELAQLTVDKARSSVSFAEKTYERQKKLAEQEGTPQKSVEAAASDLFAARNDMKIAEKQLAILRASPTPEEVAEAAAKVAEAEKSLAGAQLQRAMLKVQAPLSATVTRVGVATGEAVDSTKVLAELVALDRLVATINVPTTEASLVKIGQPAVIGVERGRMTRRGAFPASRPTTEPAAPVATYDSTVQFVGPTVDRKSDSVVVTIRVPPESGLRPGQAIHARIVVGAHADCLAVPRDCVVTNADGVSVVSVVSSGKAIQVPVRLGFHDDELIEIECEQIHAGDTIVTEGAYGLPKETKVRPIQE
jgi:RND family efflux transporter MFP subunit